MTIFGAPAYSLIYSGTQINYEMQKRNNNFWRVPQKNLIKGSHGANMKQTIFLLKSAKELVTGTVGN
jgi:hypothetical protein